MKKQEKKLLKDAKYRAKRKNLEFNLTIDDIFIPNKCPILGIDLKKGDGTCLPSSPSLDRLDSSLGYISGNVWIISHKANSMKQNASQEELIMFANWIRDMYETK